MQDSPGIIIKCRFTAALFLLFSLLSFKSALAEDRPAEKLSQLINTAIANNPELKFVRRPLADVQKPHRPGAFL